MVERIQDLNLPNSNITKIIKDSLPADVNMDKEARIAIARATSVFIMYLSSNAAAAAHKHNHKTFSAQDVLNAVNEMEFANFMGPMKASLQVHQKSMKDKKEIKKTTDARKALGSQQSVTITPIPSGMNATSKIAGARISAGQANHSKPALSISNDIIEIDDSDWGHPEFSKYFALSGTAQ